MTAKIKSTPKKKATAKRQEGPLEINRIKVVLVEIKMTQKVLAKRTGISENSIYLYCANKGQPTLRNLRKIAEETGVNIQELLIPTPNRHKK
jgi:transcriptional regulator with XRE-family HTH domain